MNTELTAALADRAKRPDADAWAACFFAALGEDVDWKEAIELADEVAPGLEDAEA